MTKSKKEEIQHRIDYEIIVDAYGDHEVKMGWYYYMEEKLNFPFTATVEIEKRNGGKEMKKVEVLKMTGDEAFGEDMRVGVAFGEYIFEVPLLSLKNIEADEGTLEAMGDWRYWKGDIEFD
ncbi:MAG TPA: calcium-binding protein [Bacteroidetes bacterium]|nr:calcium-binding protein [Bacteroidota bacterium]